MVREAQPLRCLLSFALALVSGAAAAARAQKLDWSGNYYDYWQHSDSDSHTVVSDTGAASGFVGKPVEHPREAELKGHAPLWENNYTHHVVWGKPCHIFRCCFTQRSHKECPVWKDDDSGAPCMEEYSYHTQTMSCSCPVAQVVRRQYFCSMGLDDCDAGGPFPGTEDTDFFGQICPKETEVTTDMAATSPEPVAPHPQKPQLLPPHMQPLGVEEDPWIPKLKDNVEAPQLLDDHDFGFELADDDDYWADFDFNEDDDWDDFDLADSASR